MASMLRDNILVQTDVRGLPAAFTTSDHNVFLIACGEIELGSFWVASYCSLFSSNCLTSDLSLTVEKLSVPHLKLSMPISLGVQEELFAS